MPPYYDEATRAQVVSLRSFGASAKQVTAITGIEERTQRKIVERAKEQGFEFGKNARVLNVHVASKKKSGRPRKIQSSGDERAESAGAGAGVGAGAATGTDAPAAVGVIVGLAVHLGPEQDSAALQTMNNSSMSSYLRP